MSLRARLTAALVSVAAAGLVVLAAVTYAVQRDFLLERVDEQTADAVPVLARVLAGGGGGPPDDFAPPFATGRERRGPGEAANLPPGTIGELRTVAGTRVATAVISYGEPALPAPRLPRGVRPGALRTVDATSGELRYRVRAVETRGGGLLVVAVPLAGVEAALENLLLVEGLVIAGVLVLLGLLASRLVELGLRPLDRIAAVAGEIAGGELSRRVDVDDPRTEVGRLGRAMNGMLGRLEGAFAQREASEQRLRRFLADASHELRTPLASIRGYAELHRMGATQDPEAVARSLRRIEDEAARMGVLVEDLLVLARLDELRAPERAPVDVGALVEDVVADARATAPGRDVRTDVAGTPVVEGDAEQLRRAVLNLVRNALVHTDADVEVRARDLGDRVEVEVRDHGPGLPGHDPGIVFERFWRAEGPGRERGKAGAGLGLSIVAGIVEAHGGEVAARNDGGAVLTLRLPAAPRPRSGGPAV